MKSRHAILLPFSFLLLSFLAGCQSYEIVQTNVFSDDDGNVTRVDYGRSEEPHVNYFVNPQTGKTMDFRSNLVVEVELPDGDAFTAWQCMNFLQSGTMYKTDDEDWMILANGFMCIIYRRTEPSRYREVYRGILCESPKTDYTPNPKWRNLKKTAGGSWK